MFLTYFLKLSRIAYESSLYLKWKQIDFILFL
jgi:hypothetical protein